MINSISLHFCITHSNLSKERGDIDLILFCVRLILRREERPDLHQVTRGQDVSSRPMISEVLSRPFLSAENHE